MAKFNSFTERYILEMADNGTKIVGENGSFPLTLRFCEKILGEIQTGSICAVTYEIINPLLEGFGHFFMVINRDGTIDTGSKTWVDLVQWMR